MKEQTLREFATRFGRAALRACETYSDLSRVRRDFRCCAGWLYSALYRHVELQRRKRLYTWPAVVGLDEHCFARRWRHEVLAHFDTGLTNAMTEGFNLKAKLVKRMVFGFRSFRNYRLRLLNACA
jgi:hypothetical protein